MLSQEEQQYFAEQQSLIEADYLRSEDPRLQSGFGRSDADWVRYRSAIIAPVDRSGTFLDIGCANGLLMESVVGWAQKAGFQLEPYGIEISDKLVQVARRRLPHWKDRLVVANALSWEPSTRFDYVRTELVYVPPAKRREYVERVLTRFLLPTGKLLVCAYGSSRPEGMRTEELIHELQSWGLRIESCHETLCPAARLVVTRVVSVSAILA